MPQRLSPKQKKMLQVLDDELLRAWRICEKEKTNPSRKDTPPEWWTGFQDGLLFALNATDRLQANIRGRSVMDATSNLEHRFLKR